MSASARSQAASTSNQRQGCCAPQQHRLSRRANVVARASSELKRPELKRPEAPSQPAQEAPKKLFSDAAPVEPTIASPSKVVTIEYQRQRAKEMNKYFAANKMQETVYKSKKLGWTPDNELNNGRWVMFGFAVGLLTEYATGVDFIHQLGLIVSYMGIADLD